MTQISVGNITRAYELLEGEVAPTVPWVASDECSSSSSVATLLAGRTLGGSHGDAFEDMKLRPAANWTDLAWMPLLMPTALPRAMLGLADSWITGGCDSEITWKMTLTAYRHETGEMAIYNRAAKLTEGEGAVALVAEELAPLKEALVALSREIAEVEGDAAQKRAVIVHLWDRALKVGQAVDSRDMIAWETAHNSLAALWSMVARGTAEVLPGVVKEALPGGTIVTWGEERYTYLDLARPVFKGSKGERISLEGKWVTHEAFQVAIQSTSTGWTWFDGIITTWTLRYRPVADRISPR